MAVRRGAKRKKFYLGFIGDGEVTEETATELLDVWLPKDNDVDFFAYVPAGIKRAQKGLKAAVAALDTLGIDPLRIETPKDLVESMLSTAELDPKADVYLICLWDDADEATAALVEQALNADIKVKDMCAMLDDVELSPDEPEDEPPAQPSKTRGRSRSATTNEDTAEIKVEGPATINREVSFESEKVSIDSLVRAIIHEELTKVGLTIGHNSFSHPVVKQTIRAWVDDDGNYELAGDAKKAPRGKRTVELTQDEAKDAGLVE